MQLSVLKTIIAEKIEQYLAGQIEVRDLIHWATEQEDMQTECPFSLDYWIVEAGLWAILMLGPAAGEYQTTPLVLREAISYLRGETVFPVERIPENSLGPFKLAIADKIEEYLKGHVTKNKLAEWAMSFKSHLAGLNIPRTADYAVIQNAMKLINALGGSKREDNYPNRKDLLLAIRYLRGTISFPMKGE